MIHPSNPLRDPDDNRHFLISTGRAAAGSVIFSLPLLMTMEMWNLGFYLDPVKRAIMILICIPLLVGLSHIFGFEDTFGWRDDLMDSFVALFVGFVTSGLILYFLGVIKHGSSLEEVFGKIELQIIPGSMGALLARSQFGVKSRREKNRTNYLSELFIMGVGALFLSLSIAPTEEIIQIALGMSKLQTLLLGLVSIAMMHAFVYSVDFKGTEKTHSMIPPWRLFLRFTLSGYAVVLLTSCFVLWIFGRTTGLSTCEVLIMVMVLSFPGAIGAAAARLVI